MLEELAGEWKVIAAAASTLESPVVRAAMRGALVIWLDAADDILTERMRSSDHRPDFSPTAMRARRGHFFQEVSDLTCDVGVIDARGGAQGGAAGTGRRMMFAAKPTLHGRARDPAAGRPRGRRRAAGAGHRPRGAAADRLARRDRRRGGPPLVRHQGRARRPARPGDHGGGRLCGRGGAQRARHRQPVLQPADRADRLARLRQGLRRRGPRRCCSTTPSAPRRCTGSASTSSPSTSGPSTSTRRRGSWRRGCSATRCAGTASGTTR